MKRSVAITGAPATGKTTAYYDLLEKCWRPSPSHMTRASRPGEVDGVDSTFISVEDFIARFKEGEYFEPSLDWAGYAGNYYGSPRSWITEIADDLPIVIMPSNVLATRGLCSALEAKGIRDKLLWFHLAADETTRRTRLEQRGDSPEQIEVRLQRGDTHEIPRDADHHIDTSQLTRQQVTTQILNLMGSGRTNI